MNSYFVPQPVLVHLWQACWQSTFLLLTAFMLTACLPDARSRARLLHVSLMCCGLMPLLSALLPHCILLPVPMPAYVPMVDANAPTGAGSTAEARQWLLAALVLIWLLGCAFQAARLVYDWLRVRRVLAMSVPLHSQRIDALLQRIGGVQGIVLRTLPMLESPFCWQMQRPVLVLPESLLQRPDDDLELLLRHELAHLRWGDPLCLFLEHCLVALFWFHPLVQRATQRAQGWREIACDDWALAAGGSPRRLARLLTELAERAARPSRGAWQLSAQGTPGDFHARILRLVEDRQPNKVSSVSRAGVFAALAAAALLLATLRLAGPFARPEPGLWTHWPPLTGQLLDLVGVQIVDFDLHRASHDPREQTPEHRAAHRKWPHN